MEDKRLAASQSKPHWGLEEPMALYGIARSLQLLETEGFAMTEKGGTYTGGTGTAALITSDGYALTAKHVVDQSRKFGVIEIPGSSKRLHLITIAKREGRQANFEEGIYFIPFPNPRQLSADERGKISIKSIRIVHLFEGRDLALIKLPESQAPFFDIGKMPARGDWLFASGNGISAAPSSTAGQVIKVANDKGRFLARMPSAMGDSGGPIFNREGELVGIFSKLTPEGAVKRSGLRWFQSSCCEVPARDKIEDLLSKDRSQSR